MKGSTIALFIFVAGGLLLIFSTSSKRNYALKRFETTLTKVRNAWLPEQQSVRQEFLKELESIKSELDEEKTTRYHVALARYHNLKSEYSKALVHCEKARELNTQNKDDSKSSKSLQWELPLLHGLTLLRLKKPQESLSFFDEAQKYSPKSKYIALNQSQAYLDLATDQSTQSQEYLRQAKKFANEALERSTYELNQSSSEKQVSSWAPAWNQRALVLMRQKDWYQARLDLLEALKLDPYFGRAYYNLAITSAILSKNYLTQDTDQKLGETYRAEAIRAYQELAAIAPNLSQVLYNKAGFQDFVEGVIPR